MRSEGGDEEESQPWVMPGWWAPSRDGVGEAARGGLTWRTRETLRLSSKAGLDFTEDGCPDAEHNIMVRLAF